MQIIKPLSLVLLTCSLLSCETTKPSILTTGSGETSVCGETLVGVTTEKREFQVAGATLNDFKLGNVNTTVTPEFQRIASEASMNEDSRVKIACKAMRMSGVEPSGEMLSYYMQLLGFLGSNPPPTVEQRMAWADKIPVPKAAPQVQSTPAYTWTTGPVRSSEESSATELAKTCKQPIVGLKQPPELVIQLWYRVVKKLKVDRSSSEYDLLNLYMLKPRVRYQINDPKDLFQEAHYTLKCMEEVGELRLEEPGPTKRYWGVDFPNQRIVFRNP